MANIRLTYDQIITCCERNRISLNENKTRFTTSIQGHTNLF